jgi:hypothetical protein
MCYKNYALDSEYESKCTFNVYKSHFRGLNTMGQSCTKNEWVCVSRYAEYYR